MSLDRFEQRRRSDRRRRVLRWGTGLLVVVLVVGGTWLVAFSSTLAVSSVEVHGVSTLTKQQVEGRAEVPVGRPLARLDTVAIEERVSRIARVQSVQVDRQWPHTVSITVTERRPVAWIRQDGRIRVVDRYGVDYRTVAKPPRGLVEVTIGSFDARKRQQALEESAAVVDQLRREQPRLAKALRSVSADTKDSVTLGLTKRRTVVWGSADKFDDKASVLRALLEIRASRYDVSAPEQPTTKK